MANPCCPKCSGTHLAKHLTTGVSATLIYLHEMWLCARRNSRPDYTGFKLIRQRREAMATGP